MASSDDFGDLSGALAATIGDEQAKEGHTPQKVNLDEMPLDMALDVEEPEEERADTSDLGLDLDLSADVEEPPAPEAKPKKKASNNLEVDYSSLAFEDESIGKVADEVSSQLDIAESSPADAPVRDAFGRSADQVAAASATTASAFKPSTAKPSPAVTNHQFQAPHKEIKIYNTGTGSINKLIAYGLIGSVVGAITWTLVLTFSFGILGWVALIVLALVVGKFCKMGGNDIEPNQVRIVAGSCGALAYLLGYFIFAFTLVKFTESLNSELDQALQAQQQAAMMEGEDFQEEDALNYGEESYNEYEYEDQDSTEQWWDDDQYEGEYIEDMEADPSVVALNQALEEGSVTGVFKSFFDIWSFVGIAIAIALSASYAVPND